jgi:hypothetical protein
MDVNKEIGTAVVFAQAAWILAGLFFYLTTPGAALLSGSAGVFFIGGLFVAAVIFGMPFYGLRNRIANASKGDLATKLLPIIEAVAIFVVSGLAFEQIETFRAGVPLRYTQQADDFDYALKAFTVASRLEEQAKEGRETGKIDSDIETRLVELMEAGVAKGSTVSDDFLIYLEPSLPQPYRTQLLRGHQLLAEGRRSGDLAKQTEGSELVRSFYEDFLPPRADAIIGKLGVTPQ